MTVTELIEQLVAYDASEEYSIFGPRGIACRKKRDGRDDYWK